MPEQPLDITAMALEDFTGPADALLDRVQLSVFFRFPGIGQGSFKELRRRLADLDVANRQPGERERPDLSSATIQLKAESDAPLFGGRLALSGQLRLVVGSDGVVRTTGATEVEFNPLRTLRDQVEPVCRPAPGDGGDNVVGSSAADDYPHLLGLQLDSVRRGIDDLLDTVTQAAGGRVIAEFRVRQCEVCRDLAIPDPASAIALLHQTANPRTARTRVSLFQGMPALEGDGNTPSVRWEDGRKSNKVWYKFYPKLSPDLPMLRAEVSYRDRKAIGRAIGNGQADVARNGRELADLLATIATAASPALDGMEEHVAQLQQSAQGGVNEIDLVRFAAALAPLAAVAEGERVGRGRPAGPEQRSVAAKALRHLLVHGRFDAKGLHSDRPVRRVLDAIATTDAPVLVRGGERASIFSVVPAYDAVRHAFAVAVAPASAAQTIPERLSRRRLKSHSRDRTVSAANAPGRDE